MNDLKFPVQIPHRRENLKRFICGVHQWDIDYSFKSVYIIKYYNYPWKPLKVRHYPTNEDL
jgi:hypothetical protein